jgi:ankyrin repeat protein
LKPHRRALPFRELVAISSPFLGETPPVPISHDDVDAEAAMSAHRRMNVRVKHLSQPFRLALALVLIGASIVLALWDRESVPPAEALCFAARAGDVKTIELLLSRGEDVNRAIPAYGTPLMQAAFCDHGDVMRLLLKHGAKTEIRNEFENTALWHAAIANHADAVEILLAAGADPDAPCHNGATAFAQAMAAQNAEVVRVFERHRQRRPTSSRK